MANIIDTTHNLTSYAYSNKAKISKIVINTILLFIIFAVFGCFDFVNFSMDITLVLTWKYWTNVITKVIGGSIAFNIGLNLLYDKEIENDKELALQREKYLKLNGQKNELLFNRYVEEVFNPGEKRKAWKSYINKKLYWLNKFARNKDKLLYTNGNTEEQKGNKYCERRHELEMLKSDEYIDKNINSIQIEYGKVDPILFELEIDGNGTYRGLKIKGDVRTGRARFTGGVVIGMIMFSMLTTSIVLAPDQQQFENQMLAFWHYVLVCCEDVGVILWQTFRGMVSARKLVSEELTTPYVNRNRVLDCYYKWVGDNQDKLSVGDQLAKLVGQGG